MRSGWPALLGVAAASLAACAAAGRRPQADRAQPQPEVRSNIVRADYAGAEACAPCHAGIYEAWRRSPMHNMTRLPAAAEVRAPFDGRAWPFKDDVARFTRAGDDRFVALHSAAAGDHVY